MTFAGVVPCSGYDRSLLGGDQPRDPSQPTFESNHLLLYKIYYLLITFQHRQGTPGGENSDLLAYIPARATGCRSTLSAVGKHE